MAGRAAGFVSGLGAATADAVYGCIAGFGLTFVSGFLVNQQNWLRLIGGLFLCYLGVRCFFSRPSEVSASAGDRSLIGAYASTLVLTLTNPMTILFFAAVFAGLGLTTASSDYASAGVLVLGVFLGSAAWWLLLSGVAGLFRARFHPGALRWINRISGIIISVFGIAALASLI